MKYVYPAIFTPDAEGVLVEFPDFESCYTHGDNAEDAFLMAEDVLAVTLCRLEEEKKDIPKATDIKKIHADKKAFASLVSADTLEYRKRYDKRAVKKTLSIPKWLDTLAQEKNINFSNTLQHALTERLGVQ